MMVEGGEESTTVSPESHPGIAPESTNMSPTTFRQIEMTKGIAPSATEERSPLSDWYERVRDVPLSAFGIEDLCKSVRQAVFPDYVVPVALDRLEEEPLAGEMYDGELAAAFRWIPQTFWSEHRQIAARMVSVLEDALPRLSDDVQGDVSAIVACIEAATR
jgi:hypothetical protein